MIILQVRGIHQSLRFHLSEWGCAGMLVVWGAIVINGGDVFANSPAWRILASWAPEWIWGGVALVLGSARLIVLMRNGEWVWGHQARLVLAFLCCFLWTSMLWALIQSGIPNTGIAAYLLPLALDLGTIRNASFDAERYAEARRHGAV
jgi:hypothetical protein